MSASDGTGRREPPTTAGERDTLAGFLDWQRDTLAMKCAGLDAERLRRKEIPPSDLSLLGLVRHMAEVERGWFRHVVCGEESGSHWPRVNGGMADFLVADADAEEAFAVWRAECENSRAIVASRDLDERVHRRDETYTVRWIVTHMIEEYARHNGHADLLRERIDGVTGE
ncbi:DinB family protein [Actinomadura harenae]|uniref:DinB family protein n=1 Tax=Actinomadura harenae TaxID=2483351 RepID=A0A3M2LTX6_9ACTN|nr:DinB family protein [Actinomadura harenae]RMI40682.1 DinB family protein [Actinomadura harenae]